MKRTILHIDQILAWADRHHELTGKWPQRTSGRVLEALDEGWQAIDLALYHGCRGLPRRGSLARLLAQHRGVRNIQGLPSYTIRQILAWADAYYAEHGQWPTPKSGPIAGSDGETWSRVESALQQGRRGLKVKTSLPRLLAEKRGAFLRSQQPPLSIEQILAWADTHHEQTGNWPTIKSGAVGPATHDTWHKIDEALRKGHRGLPEGLSLARLLARHRGVSRHVRRRPLTLALILRWADAHRARTGKWPTARLGAVADAPGETWHRLDRALRLGQRGLPAGMTLAQLLVVERNVRNRAGIPELSERQILAWADAFHARRRKWPVRTSGRIHEAPGETWVAIDIALRRGRRGLPGGSSLARLLAAKRRVPNKSAQPRYSLRQILAWADAYHDRMGKWPTVWSGRVGPYVKDTWHKIDKALRSGYRGLPGNQSLAMLLKERRRASRLAAQ
ncbi:MAG: hypothetical protein HY000_33155 [Planctomycetes bacterium]|nr:hypothetical protein [Planctomycetota bacterium]